MIAASSFWTHGELWVVLFAMFGGLVVLWGLWMEYSSEDEKRYEKIGIDGFRKLKARGRCGEVVVMIGIIIEVVIGAGLVVKDDIEINAAKIAWRTQRIYAFEATAKLIVRPLLKPDDFENLPKGGWFRLEPTGPTIGDTKKDPGRAYLYLGRSWDMANEMEGYSRKFAMIQADDVERSVAVEVGGTNQFLRYEINFSGVHSGLIRQSEWIFDFDNAELTPDDLDAIEICLPTRCEIIAGQLKMRIDGGLTNRIFNIPPQTTFVNMATSVETNGVFIPIDFSPKVRAENEKDNAVK